MKVSVWHSEGSFEDMQGQIKDVVSSVLRENAFEPSDEVLRVLVTGQVQEQLKLTARKIGGDNGHVKVTINDGPLARGAMGQGELSGYVDLTVRFYFESKPEPKHERR